MGFTLLEVIIVLTIVAIVAMLVLPQFESMINESRLNAAAGELVSGLEYASNLAALYERPFGIRASVGGTNFTVFDARYKSDAAAHTAATPPVTGYGVVVNPADRKWYSCDLQGAAITAAPTNGEVLFYPMGHCAVSSNVVVVAYRSRTRTLTVNGLTGRVAVQ